jgi:hypothetical protein
MPIDIHGGGVEAGGCMRATVVFWVLVIAGCGSGAATVPAPDGADAPAPVDAAAPPPDAPIADASGAPADTAPVTSDGPAGGSDVVSSPADAASLWPVVTDYGARGPLAIARDRDTGPGGAYDVIRPASLGDGRKHPILSWANGTNYPLDDYVPLLEHWASHGFVVIAGHTNTTAGGVTHKAGIDWLVAENGRAGGPYAGALDVKMIGAAGHSQGGGATIAAGSDAPGPTGLVATAPLMPLLSFEKDPTVVSRQKVPMLNVNASNDDRDPAGKVASQIFGGASGTLVQAAFNGVHTDAMNPAMHGPTLAWFRLHLMADQNARALFYPAESCGLCRDPAWKSVRYKP